MPGAKQKAQMFDDFLVWPRNSLDVVLVVRFTSPTGVGPSIGMLTVKNSEVTPCSRRAAAKSSDDSAVSRGITTTAPPVSSAPQISQVAASKLMLATCARRVPGPKRT